MVNTHTPQATAEQCDALAGGIDRRSFLKATGAGLVALPLIGCGARTGSLSGDVIVVGAGLSGLAGAMLLEERGLDVTVVEARNRLGGRVVTMHDIPGRPEGGGPVISESYERVMKIAAAVGAEMGPGPSFERTAMLHVNGQAATTEAWATSAANSLPPSERTLSPSLLLGSFTGLDNPLVDEDDWIDGAYAALDVPLSDYLRGKGASDEALRLINVAPNTNNVATTSALWALRNAQRRRDSKGGKIVSVAGGNSVLTNRMGAWLRGPILLDKPVLAIRSRPDRVSVECADGTLIEADFCLVTVPYSVLRTIDVEPAFTGRQAEAVEQLPYTAITKYYFVPKTRFWDEDGLPVFMWTDTAGERVFPHRGADGEVQSLTCWVDGEGARRLDAMPEDEQVRTVLDELARVRPSTRDALEPVGLISWGRDPWALGAYAHYAPGQVSRLKPVMAQPWQRLHFAGEHTAVTSPGIESAIEAAQRATREIIARLS